MKLDTWLAVLVISISAAFAISGKYQKSRFVHYAFKPLTMVMIISLAFERVTSFPSFYGYFVLTGLCVSLLGDVFLMLPARYFKPGLLAFLAVQVLYALAFGRGLKAFPLTPLLVILVYAGLVFLFLYRRLGAYRWPVLFNILAVSCMAWLAVSRHLALLGRSSLLAGGAILILFSDSVNAVNRFRKPFRPAEVLILDLFCRRPRPFDRTGSQHPTREPASADIRGAIRYNLLFARMLTGKPGLITSLSRPTDRSHPESGGKVQQQTLPRVRRQALVRLPRRPRPSGV
jgi:uncharacterized membrane protein YhhN